MRGSVRSTHIFRFAGAVAALWLCGAGSAWAGGGKDAGALQKAVLDPLCIFLGITSCPQLPTISQIVLETSALENTPPNLVRSQVIGVQLSGGTGACSVAGNPPSPGVVVPVCDKLAINAVNPPAGSNPASLSSLTPLAFFSPLTGSPPTGPVPPGTKGANSFFYGAATGASGQPDTLTLFFDYPPLTSQTFAKGQIVAMISLPLEVLNADGSERLVCGTKKCSPPSVATLQISASCNGGLSCLTTANVIGDFSKPGTTEARSAGDLGLQWAVTFGPSPNLSKTHAIFEVQAPLLVTGPTDPAYFGVTPSGATNGSATGSPTGVNQASGLPTAFSNDFGFTPAFLGAPVGIAPFAAPPLCVGTTCPAQSTFPFCASFLVNGTLNPAVAAFLTIGTDGTTYVSSPIPPVAGVQCPF